MRLISKERETGDRLLSVRLSPELYGRLARACTAAGGLTISEGIRQLISGLDPHLSPDIQALADETEVPTPSDDMSYVRRENRAATGIEGDDHGK